jgi:hypothetical protein
MKRNNVLVLIAVALMIGLFVFGVTSFSVIESQEEDILFTSATCNVDSDCDNYFLSQGITQSALDEQKELADLICVDEGYCIARAK